MLKKVMLLGASLVFLLSFNTADTSAAVTDGQVGDISYGQETATTSRITLKAGQKLSIESITFGGTIHYRIFKNGENFSEVLPTSSSFGPKLLSGLGAGEYSLRAYCGHADNRKTNCASIFKIFAQD